MLLMRKIGSSDGADLPLRFPHNFKTFEKADAFTGVVITFYYE